MNDYQKKIFFFLYHKYYRSLTKTANNLLRTIFYSIPLETEDLINHAIVTFIEKHYYKFNPKTAISFQCYFLTKSKFSMLSYASSFVSKKHIILNNYLPYDDCINKSEQKRIIINYDCLNQLEKKLIEDKFEMNYDIKTLARQNAMSPQLAKIKIEKALRKLRKYSYKNF